LKMLDWEGNGHREPVLKQGPNTACGGNARERAWLLPFVPGVDSCMFSVRQ
jgi:hypothetical protein